MHFRPAPYTCAKSGFQSTLSTGLRTYNLIGTALLLIITMAMVPAITALDSSTIGKISPRLLTATANGGRAEALIVLAEQGDLSAAAGFPTKLDKGRYVVRTLQTVAERSQGPLRSFLHQRGIPFQAFYIVNMIKMTANRALLEELAARPEVAHIDANPQITSSLLGTEGTDAPHPNGVEWNVARVNAPQVWALGYRGEGFVVAGNDTGVKWDHPALKTHYRGWNGSGVDHDYNWHDATSDHSPVPIDPNAHGTFTVSEMVGDDGVGNQVGVAPGAQWIACRNMDRHGTGSPAAYIECFEFLIAPYPFGHPELANPTLAPDAINNSWDCPPSEGCSQDTLLLVVAAVRAAGIFPAMATGNSGPNCSTVSNVPEIYENSVSVGATDSYNAIAPFSSRGPVLADGSHRLKPELSAPGVNIRGAIPYNNMYQGYWSGTSMAVPHLTGGVALLWQARPELVADIDNTEKAFTHSAGHLTPLHDCGGGSGPGSSGPGQPNNVFGYGLLDLLKAVQSH